MSKRGAVPAFQNIKLKQTMSNKKEVIVVGNAHAGIDAARLLGGRADDLKLYASTVNANAKMHLCEDSSEPYLCGIETGMSHEVNPEINSEWVMNALKAPVGMCKKCLSKATKHFNLA